MWLMISTRSDVGLRRTVYLSERQRTYINSCTVCDKYHSWAMGTPPLVSLIPPIPIVPKVLLTGE